MHFPDCIDSSLFYVNGKTRASSTASTLDAVVPYEVAGGCHRRETIGQFNESPGTIVIGNHIVVDVEISRNTRFADSRRQIDSRASKGNVVDFIGVDRSRSEHLNGVAMYDSIPGHSNSIDRVAVHQGHVKHRRDHVADRVAVSGGDLTECLATVGPSPFVYPSDRVGSSLLPSGTRGPIDDPTVVGGTWSPTVRPVVNGQILHQDIGAVPHADH